MDQVEIVTLPAEIKNHLASLERLMDHIRNRLRKHTHYSNRRHERVSDIVTTLFPYLACHAKRSLRPEPHAFCHLDKPEPACQHRIMLSGIDLFT